MLSEIYLKAIKKVITVVEDIIGEPKTTGWLKKSLWSRGKVFEIF